MKYTGNKIILLFILLFIFLNDSVQAQGLKTISDFLQKNELARAKEPVDLFTNETLMMQKAGEILDKYTQAGIKNFPLSAYFELNYIDWLRGKKDYQNMLSLYESIFKKGFTDKQISVAYYNDLFNYLYNSKELTGNRENYKSTLLKGLIDFLKKYPEENTARLLLAKCCINHAANIQKEKLIGQTAKKNQVTMLLKKSNLYLIEIVDKSLVADKSVYNESLQLLINNFTILKLNGQVKGFKMKFRK